jgi:hypothetical protein
MIDTTAASMWWYNGLTSQCKAALAHGNFNARMQGRESASITRNERQGLATKDGVAYSLIRNTTYQESLGCLTSCTALHTAVQLHQAEGLVLPSFQGCLAQHSDATVRTWSKRQHPV